MKEFKMKSWDSEEIYCTIWDEVEKPRGVVQIAHGMAEYAGRYDRFAKFLNQNGYIVFADDHRAHGRTEPEKTIGHRKGFIFGETLKDLVFFHNYLKEKYNLPQIFIGHSYGSFLGQAFYQQGTDAKGVVLIGSSLIPSTVVAIGMTILSPLQLVCKGFRSRAINKVSDKLFSLKYKGDSGPSQWITRDMERRQNFISDPMCSIPMSINFTYSMLRGIFITNKKNERNKIQKDVPLEILSGSMDPIGGWGKKISSLYDFYKKHGVKNLTFKLYDGGRHEVLNETNYKEVYGDILSFIDGCIM